MNDRKLIIKIENEEGTVLSVTEASFSMEPITVEQTARAGREIRKMLQEAYIRGEAILNVMRDNCNCFWKKKNNGLISMPHSSSCPILCLSDEKMEKKIKKEESRIRNSFK